MALTTSSTGAVSGLISGMDTSTIISKMMALAQQPQALLQANKSEAQTKLATWQSLNTSVLALNTKANALAVPGAFTQCNANSSNMNIVQASASTDAAPGTYYLTVNSRAQGHQIAALAKGATPTAFTSTTSDVGTGDVNFSFGDGSPKNFKVTIDETNNTLTGLRDAINKANKGIQASIVNSGTTSSPAFQLVLNSTDTGAASQFTATGGDNIKVDFSTIIQKGTNADITLGGGGTGTTPITVTKSTNSFDDLIPGVTLNIISPDKNTTVKIDVTANTDVIKSSIQDFVTAYNNLSDAIDQQTAYDSSSKQGGTLLGDWDLQSVQMNISDIVGKIVPGLSKNYNSLAAIGITQDTGGHLQINDSTLSNALNSNLTNVSHLFSSSMTSDSGAISFVNSTSDTQSSPATGWSVNITQAARQAQVTAGKAMTTVLGADETLSINLASDSTKTQSITLAKYSSLSSVVTQINNYTTQTGVTAVATDSTGTVNSDSSQNTYLSLKSNRYGSSADVGVISSLDSGDGGDTTGIGNVKVTVEAPGNGAHLSGLDVEGTINGQACKGNGQILTAASLTSNITTKGLSLLITSSTPVSSTIHFTKGLATSLRDTIIGMTSIGGTIMNAEDSLTKQMSDLDKQIADMQTSLDAQQQKLQTEFDSMESQLGTLQQQGNYLTQQFAAMTKSTS